MTDARTFHVVTMRNWMVEELVAALEPAGWRVVRHFGLDPLPPEVGTTPEHVLWTPGAFAAREIARGNPLRLSAPGPHWLPKATDPLEVDSLPTRREVTLTTAAKAAAAPSEGFWKLAESKLDLFPARWRTADDLVVDIAEAALPGAAPMHYTPVRLSFIGEWRAAIIGDRAAALSCYLDTAGRDRSDPAFTEPAPVVSATARRMTEVFSKVAAQELPAGPAYTMDVGRTPQGWVIVEVNPVWSSAWYGMDLPAFADAVAAAQGDSVPEEFVWKPDAALGARVAIR